MTRRCSQAAAAGQKLILAPVGPVVAGRPALAVQEKMALLETAEAFLVAEVAGEPPLGAVPLDLLGLDWTEVTAAKLKTTRLEARTEPVQLEPTMPPPVLRALTAQVAVVVARITPATKPEKKVVSVASGLIWTLRTALEAVVAAAGVEKIRAAALEVTEDSTVAVALVQVTHNSDQ